MVRVFVADSVAEAHFICGLLMNHEIEAYVEGEMLGAAQGEFGFGMNERPGVKVAARDAQRARQIIEKRQTPED